MRVQDFAPHSAAGSLAPPCWTWPACLLQSRTPACMHGLASVSAPAWHMLHAVSHGGLQAGLLGKVMVMTAPLVLSYVACRQHHVA